MEYDALQLEAVSVNYIEVTLLKRTMKIYR